MAKSASERVKELIAEGKTGKQIALVFLKEDYNIQDTGKALLKENYVVAQLSFTADIPVLHVSDEPQEPGFVALMISVEPQTLPSVIWDKGYYKFDS